jgi:hypothetical protein
MESEVTLQSSQGTTTDHYPWGRWIQPTSTHLISLRSILILLSYLCLGPYVDSWNRYITIYDKKTVLSMITNFKNFAYDSVSKSFRTGLLERELKMVQLSATRCSCIDILWVSLASFDAITLCIASERVFIVVVYFVIDSVRKNFG